MRGNCHHSRYVHLGIYTNETLASVQLPKPLIPMDEFDKPTYSHRGVPKPHPLDVDTYEHIASCCLTPVSTGPTNNAVISSTDNTSTSTHRNLPNWHDANILRLPEVHGIANRRSTLLSNGRVQCTIASPLCFAPIWNPIGGFNWWLLEGPTTANGSMPRWDTIRILTVFGGDSDRSHFGSIPIHLEYLRGTNSNQLPSSIPRSLWWQYQPSWTHCYFRRPVVSLWYLWCFEMLRVPDNVERSGVRVVYSFEATLDLTPSLSSQKSSNSTSSGIYAWGHRW